MKFAKHLLLAAVAALAAGLGSCSKDTAAGEPGYEGDPGTGSVTVSFGFDRSASTYATPSTAKPTTSWKDNIKDLVILFVDPATGTIKDSRVLEVPTSNDIANKSFTMINIKAGTYTAYVLANAAQSDVNRPNDVTISALTGRVISQVLLQAVACTSGEDGYYTPQPPTGGGEATVEKPYKPAPEIFAACKTDFKVEANRNNEMADPFQLTRLVSLFRVRINHTVGVDASVQNDKIHFDDAKASLRIRRTPMQVGFTQDGKYTYAKTIDDFQSNEYKDFGQYLTFSGNAFLSQNPTTGYTGTVLNENEGFKFWKDVMIFPGGAVDPAEGSDLGQDERDKIGYSKFDIVLIAKADEGYVPAGATKPFGPDGGYVAWTGAVSGKVTANNILEVNTTLKTAGIDIVDPDKPVIPEPETYGNLEIQINLAEWGNITSTDIEM